MGDRSYLCSAAAIALIGLSASAARAADDELTLYCSPQIEWCQVMVEEFQKATGSRSP